MYKKLTYSGTECNNYLYFSFDAEYFDTKEITEKLNIEPTSVMTKKEPVPKSTAWIYKIDAGNEIDLETFLEKLIDIFEPKIEIINNLKDRLNLTTRIQFVIDIDINPDSSTPYFGLNKRTIDFLAKTESKVDFDLSKLTQLGYWKNGMNKKTAYNSGFTKWRELFKPDADFPLENLILAETNQSRTPPLREAGGTLCDTLYQAK